MILTGRQAQHYDWHPQYCLGELLRAEDTHSPDYDAVGEDIYHERDKQCSCAPNKL